MAEGKIIRSRMNKEAYFEFRLLKERLALDNESLVLKRAVALANHYLDHIEKTVPQDIFETYLYKLKYGYKPYDKGFNSELEK